MRWYRKESERIRSEECFVRYCDQETTTTNNNNNTATTTTTETFQALFKFGDCDVQGKATYLWYSFHLACRGNGCIDILHLFGKICRKVFFDVSVCVVFLSCPLVKKHADLSGSFLYSQSTMKDMYSKPTNRTELLIPMKTKSIA